MPKTTKQFLALLRNGNIGIPLVILSILAMVIPAITTGRAGYSVHL